MLAYILRRLLLMVPTLFLILLTNFVLVQAAPGGPVEQAIERAKTTAGIGQASALGGSGNEQAQGTSADTARYQGSRGLSPEMIEQIKKQYGFDQPAYLRFWHMLSGYARLDFGESFFKGRQVTTLIAEKPKCWRPVGRAPEKTRPFFAILPHEINFSTSPATSPGSAWRRV